MKKDISNILFKTFSASLILSIVITAVLVMVRPYWDNDPTMGGFATLFFLAFTAFPLLVIGLIGIIATYITRKLKQRVLTNFHKVFFYLAILIIVAIPVFVLLTGLGL